MFLNFYFLNLKIFVSRRTWSLDREGIHATEVLVVSILHKQLHDRLVWYIAKMLQYEQACHQPDGFCRPAIVLAVERRERLLKHGPIYEICQFEEGVLGIEHCLKIPEKGGLLGLEDDLYITVLQGFTMQRHKIMLEYPNIRMVILLNYNNLTGCQGTTSSL